MKYFFIKISLLYFSLISISVSQEVVVLNDYDIISCDDCITKDAFVDTAIRKSKSNKNVVVINMNTLKAVCFKISNNKEKKAIEVESFKGVDESMNELAKLQKYLG